MSGAFPPPPASGPPEPEPEPEPEPAGLRQRWSAIPKNVRPWLIAGAVVAVLAAVGAVFGEDDGGGSGEGGSDEERRAYNECVQAAEDLLVFADQIEPEPFEDAEVGESPDGLRVDVYIEATLTDGSDASGAWACGVSDDGEIVGLDTPELGR